MSKLATIQIFHRCLVVKAQDIGVYNIITRYCHHHLFKPKMAVSHGHVETSETEGDYFYIARECAYEVMLHKSHLEAIKTELRLAGVLVNTIDVKSKHKPKRVRFKTGFSLMEPAGSKYEWQNQAAPLVVANDHNIFELQMGKGKSIGAMKGVVLRAELPIFITKPAYMSKWAMDITNGLKLVKDENFVVVNELKQLEVLARDGGDPSTKAYLISSFVINAYIKMWSENPDYIHPSEIMERLGAGITVYDEAHELFRMQYWSYMGLNSPAVLDLSGTLIPDDTFLKKRYAERFPTDAKFQMELDVYTDVVGLAFRIGDRKIAQRVNRLKMYNHHVFESKIMKKPRTLENYFDLLYKTLKRWYLDGYKEGQKALFLFYMRDMCDKFTEYLKRKGLHQKIVRYINGDSFEDAIQGDIIVSTHGKSGTAVDIPGLIVNIICVSMSASQKSLQMFGRTRDGCIARWGINPTVIYPICVDIPKQISTYNERRKLLTGRVNSMITTNSGIII